jgi:solute carrier family 50 protein (sugar transporter)
MVLLITDILGIIGNALSILFFIIPATIIVEYIRTKDHDKVPYLLFVFSILNCEFWAIYGAKINAWPLIACNAVGLFTNHIFLTLFIVYLNIELLKKVLLILGLYLGFALTFTLFFVLIKNANIFGAIAMIMNILMFISPLQNLHKVIKLQDNTFIPIYVSSTLILNCIAWALYGYFKNIDVYVIIPNVLGLALAITQVILWSVYKKDSYRLDSEDDENRDRKGLKSV